MVDLMHSTSVEIYNAKKKALEEGGDAIKQQVAQGKDVISDLSKTQSVVVLQSANATLSSEGEHERDGRGQALRVRCHCSDVVRSSCFHCFWVAQTISEH
jgi:hypothetical protein